MHGSSRSLPYTFLLIMSFVAMRIASEATANISYILIAGFALLGRTQAIIALALSCLFTMINPGVAAEASGVSVWRYVVLLAAALSVFIRSGLGENCYTVRRVTMYTFMLGLFIVIHSLLFSSIPDVSILKAVSWTLAMCTLVAAWAGLNANERDDLANKIYYGLVVLMLASLPLIVTSVGYLRNDTGFQGLLNHPQAFGPTMALLGAWATCRLLESTRPSWSAVAIVAGSLVMVILSEARTAGVAMVFGIMVSVVLAPRLAGRSMLSALPGIRSYRMLLFAIIGVFGLVFLGSKLESAVAEFLSKSGRSEAVSVWDAYESSRGKLMELMWLNIESRPFSGIGFGIASDPLAMDIDRDPLLGLPVGAAIEKGVLPIAVWEELGLFGVIFVSIWVLMLMTRSARGGVAPFAVVSTALLLNLGESTMFSPGGLGLLSMLLIAWAFSCAQNTRGNRS